MTDTQSLQTWVGRSEVLMDIATRGPQQRLAALLDHETPPWRPDEVPPLGHWFYFLPEARQSQIGPDGHPKRGGFLPPVDLPRRMWAGGRFAFPASLPLDAAIQRRSTVTRVQEKTGASGRMIFVTVEHQVEAAGRVCVVEEHDIVYREPPAPGAGGPSRPDPDMGPATATRQVVGDAVRLFRYSALTFNGHRIHYDRDYVTQVEGYPGLIVHGPYIATLLMDHYLRQHPRADVATFSFRALRPVFDGRPFELRLREVESGAVIWAVSEDGVAMTADLTVRS
jgi:3-methylfumaryl-CoA hydratase